MAQQTVHPFILNKIKVLAIATTWREVTESKKTGKGEAGSMLVKSELWCSFSSFC